jgi:hypothetical protein
MRRELGELVGAYMVREGSVDAGPVVAINQRYFTALSGRTR